MDLSRESKRTLDRLEPRLETRFADYISKHPEEWQVFEARLNRHFEDLFRILHHLYGEHYDFFFFFITSKNYWVCSPVTGLNEALN